MACEDFALPSELSKTQILAIASDPVVVESGESATIDLLLAGEGGTITDADVSWRALDAQNQETALGTVTGDGVQVSYQAPVIEASMLPTAAVLEASVDVGLDQRIVGLKAVGIGNLPLENPTIDSLEIDGQAGSEMTPVELAAGSEAEVAITTTLALTEDDAIAWYSNVGTIELYTSNPTTIEVGTILGDGVIIAVLRNDTGGVSWRTVAVTVVPTAE